MLVPSIFFVLWLLRRNRMTSYAKNEEDQLESAEGRESNSGGDDDNLLDTSLFHLYGSNSRSSNGVYMSADDQLYQYRIK
jgi:hypothetical protein